MAKGKQDSDNTETGTPEAPKSLRIKYTGPSVHRRVINAKDFSAVGIDDVTKKEWSRENNHTVDFDGYEGDKEALVRFFESDAMKGTFKVLQPGEL